MSGVASHPNPASLRSGINVRRAFQAMRSAQQDAWCDGRIAVTLGARRSSRATAGRLISFFRVNCFALFGQREIAEIFKRSANGAAISATDDCRRCRAFNVCIENDAQSITMDANELKSRCTAHVLTQIAEPSSVGSLGYRSAGELVGLVN
jgi:hypothetical protein